MADAVYTFYRALRDVEEFEAIKKRAEIGLKKAYAELIQNCPHSEAVQAPSGIRGCGPLRICKICGVEDHSLIGQTTGDEYDYGYAGRIDEKFWGDCEVEQFAKINTEFWKYRRGHNYRVSGGEAREK